MALGKARAPAVFSLSALAAGAAAQAPPLHWLCFPRFAVNVGKDSNTLMLHFNPRFDCHGDVNTIVCNSKEDGMWGEEDRKADFPFQHGDKIEVRPQGCVQSPGTEGPRAQLFNAALCLCGAEGAGMERGMSHRGRVWQLKPSQCPAPASCWKPSSSEQ